MVDNYRDFMLSASSYVQRHILMIAASTRLLLMTDDEEEGSTGVNKGQRGDAKNGRRAELMKEERNERRKEEMRVEM